VDRNGPVHPELGSPCWLWTGKPNKDGYGRIRFSKTRAPLVHRALWEECVGVVEFELDHLCSVRACVNGDHLEDAPHEVNVRRGRGGQNWAAKTECPQGHLYDEKNTRLYRGSRHCRRCVYERARAWRLANPEKHREAVRRSRARRKAG
jgi:hypothetical protein